MIMTEKRLMNLSRRERQIMDVVFERGQATAADIRAALPDPPSYSTVRTQLRVLEEKGLLTHVEQGPRYVFSPTIPAERARVTALQHLKRTFFSDSTENVVSALLNLPDSDMSDEDFDRLTRLIQQARREGN
jgi:BlaI family penicillinase repressor